ARLLKIEIGVVDLALHGRAERTLEHGGREPGAVEQSRAHGRYRVGDWRGFWLRLNHAGFPDVGARIRRYNSRRCARAGNFSRRSLRPMISRSAHTRPGPPSLSARISPQGPTIIECP